jgi:hypothetical protein
VLRFILTKTQEMSINQDEVMAFASTLSTDDCMNLSRAIRTIAENMMLPNIIDVEFVRNCPNDFECGYCKSTVFQENIDNTYRYCCGGCATLAPK